MCGTLKLEDIKGRIGNLLVRDKPWVTVELPDGSTESAPILGFKREESPLLPDIQEEVVIPHVVSYTERDSNLGDIEFELPENSRGIRAVLTRRDTLPHGKGVFIVTRPATRDELRRCNHRRHPARAQ